MTRTMALGGVAVIALLIGGTALYVGMNTTDDQFAQCRESTVGTGTASIGGPRYFALAARSRP